VVKILSLSHEDEKQTYLSKTTSVQGRGVSVFKGKTKKQAAMHASLVINDSTATLIA